MRSTEFFFNLTDYQQLLRVSNGALALSAAALIATALICHPFSDSFSITQLVASHLCLICSATLLKISYVGRCVAQHGLKMEVR